MAASQPQRLQKMERAEPLLGRNIEFFRSLLKGLVERLPGKCVISLDRVDGRLQQPGPGDHTQQ